MIPLRDINPTERFPIVTLLLILANIAVFFYELMLGDTAGENFVLNFAVVPAQLFSHGAAQGGMLASEYRLVTSMFIHGGILHLAGNMLYLWIFGNNVEDSMGRSRFILFYVLCGVGAAYAHAASDRTSLVPMIGASGAISGVLGAYTLLYPRARVITLLALGFYIRTIEIPAIIVLGFWFFLQFVNALVQSGAHGGVAWYAHLGGFIAGILFIGLFKKRTVPFGGGRRSREA